MAEDSKTEVELVCEFVKTGKIHKCISVTTYNGAEIEDIRILIDQEQLT